MIMPKKKRMLLTSVIVMVVILIIAIISCIVLYMTTDLFKSNRELFTKYAKDTFYNVNKLFDDENMNEMNQIFQNNKYEIASETSINYKEENKENAINNIKLIVNGKVDENEKYNYQDIALKNKENEKLYGIEYLKDNNQYGIRINGIQQFATEKIGDNNQEKTLLGALEINPNDENEMNILKLFSEMSFKNTKIKLTEEENVNLQNRYVGILMKNVTEDKISKKQNVIITINDKKINTNAYIVTLTKEQLNNIHIEMLNQLKKDDIILSKIEEVEKIRHQYKMMTGYEENENSIKEEFVKEIDEEIKEIQNSNIGNDIRKITVFENNMKSIAMQIESDEATTIITTISDGNNTTYEYLKQETTEKENSTNIKIEKISNINDDTFNVEYNVINDDVKTTNYLTKNTKFDKDTAKTSIEIVRKNQNAEIKINSGKEEKTVNEFKDKLIFNKENSVNINEVSQEQRDNINNIMKKKNDEQVEKFFKVVSREEINNILEKLELKLEEADDISGEGFISNAERNRFNSNFEFYEGKKVPKDNVLKLIEVTKNNLEEIRVTKYKEQKNNSKNEEPEVEEYKLTIKKNKSNEILASKLATNIKNSKDQEYDVKIEYSQKTGLVENIFITVSE